MASRTETAFDGPAIALTTKEGRPPGSEYQALAGVASRSPEANAATTTPTTIRTV